MEIKVIADLILQPMDWSSRRAQPREGRDGGGSKIIVLGGMPLCHVNRKKKGLVHQVGCCARELRSSHKVHVTKTARKQY